MPSTTPSNWAGNQFNLNPFCIQINIYNFEHFFRGVVKDKTKGVADAAQDKVEEVYETCANNKMVEELKKNPSTILEDAENKLEVAKGATEERVEEAKENSSTILEDAGEKLEVAKEAMKEKLGVAKGAMEEKVEEVKEKMAPEKEDGSAAKKEDSE